MALSGGQPEVLVDWGHRTTLISSPVNYIFTDTVPDNLTIIELTMWLAGNRFPLLCGVDVR